MIRRFLGSIQFLTVLPIAGSTSSPGDAALFFPLTGAMLGASAGCILLMAARLSFNQSIGGLLALVWLLAITGCLHEDGLADVADALRAGRSRQRMMEILKDSRIGTYGAIALILSIAVRWQSLVLLTNPVPALAASLALSRSSLVALAALAPAAGTGLGQAFAASCSRGVLLAVIIQSIAISGFMAIFIGWRTSSAMVAGSIVTVMLARRWFLLRLGGVNGDCLGATCQAVEIVNLVILTWQPSI